MTGPATYNAKVVIGCSAGDTLVLMDADADVTLAININPNTAAEIKAALTRYEEHFERVSLVAEVNRWKKSTEESKKQQKIAQQALSRFDEKHL